MDANTSSVEVPMTTNINAYRKARMKMLERDFHIYLTEAEIDHMNELTSEIAIDNFYISLIQNHY